MKTSKTKLTVAQAIDNVNKFCVKNGVVFEQDGEVGFWRSCVGIMHGDSYVDYSPYDMSTLEPIFPDDKRLPIPPHVNCYDQHGCLAVLVTDEVSREDAILQMSDWVDAISEEDYAFEKYETNATGMRALFSGFQKMCIRVKGD